MAKDEQFMRRALVQARSAADADEVPVGAVIVYKNKVIGQSHNQIETLKDPTAHAEMIAITQAASWLGEKWLKGCRLYVTLEPCSMCAGAIILSRIDKVIFAAADPKTGAFGSRIDIGALGLNHRVKVKSGVLAEECT